uniref:Uncharacterized protein n=1 Tax=Anguilla anguilla TaxID=7936 RepID=A0A0E9TQ20_ANGAN
MCNSVLLPIKLFCVE